ncbi:MAG: hypothetical protein CVU11_09785 [Bacteroidetes bacterium HGW-Bacteroidetes-6]|jgi:hypothetical protein|nr:MAG: hypothetical protein CVU11_09785 [Bacteroidetes bacterium HGW-Bacteroidetes-6]
MKLLKVTIITLSVFLGGLYSQTYAQDVEFKRSGNWEFLYEMDGVNFYYNVVECHDEANSYHREYIHLKLENTNDYDVVAEWDVIMYYNGKCLNCDEKLTQEHHRSVTVPANSSVEGECMTFGDKTLRIFSRLLNYNDPTSTLTKFELINRTISKIK